MILKGQVATEFFVYSSVFLIVVLSAYSVIFFVQNIEKSNMDLLYVKSFGENFAVHINTAMNAQEGFNYTMKFDKRILGKEYRVLFRPTESGKNAFTFISWSEKNISYVYPIGNIALLNGTCVSKPIPPKLYYEINTNLEMVNFYNDGEKIIISQMGC